MATSNRLTTWQTSYRSLFHSCSSVQAKRQSPHQQHSENFSLHSGQLPPQLVSIYQLTSPKPHTRYPRILHLYSTLLASTDIPAASFHKTPLHHWLTT